MLNSECMDGTSPVSGLIQAANGNFYGTTDSSGTLQEGTIFEITTSGTLTTVYNFGVDGANPDSAALVQDTNGNLYGATEDGGDFNSTCPSGCGTVFSLSIGLGPFVGTQTTSGKVGAAVKILGTNLTGATSVTFNSTAAIFTVASKSEITTTVPVGATTGEVKVVTSGGTLTSNVPFRVTPQLTSFTPASGPVETIVTITGVSLTQNDESNAVGRTYPTASQSSAGAAT